MYLINYIISVKRQWWMKLCRMNHTVWYETLSFLKEILPFSVFCHWSRDIRWSRSEIGNINLGNKFKTHLPEIVRHYALNCWLECVEQGWNFIVWIGVHHFEANWGAAVSHMLILTVFTTAFPHFFRGTSHMLCHLLPCNVFNLNLCG